MYMSIVGIIDAIVSSTLTADTSDPCNQHHHAQHGHIEYTRRFDDENNLQHQQHTTIQQDSHHHHQHQQQWSRKHTLIPVRIVCVAEKCPTISATMSGFMNCTIMTIIIGGMVVRIIFLVLLLLFLLLLRLLTFISSMNPNSILVVLMSWSSSCATSLSRLTLSDSSVNQQSSMQDCTTRSKHRMLCLEQIHGQSF